uniref:(northern house mosquito) hypothetical protein n=1 Tax=Culex pipiens TaxID=7175 RepID=A0A8D8A2F6_CULPI
MWSSLECVPEPPLDQRRAGGKGSIPVDSAAVRSDPAAQSQVHLWQHDHHQSVPHHGRPLRVRNRRIHTARASDSGARDVQQGQLLRRERQDRQHREDHPERRVRPGRRPERCGRSRAADGDHPDLYRVHHPGVPVAGRKRSEQNRRTARSRSRLGCNGTGQHDIHANLHQVEDRG